MTEKQILEDYKLKAETVIELFETDDFKANNVVNKNLAKMILSLIARIESKNRIIAFMRSVIKGLENSKSDEFLHKPLKDKEVIYEENTSDETSPASKDELALKLNSNANNYIHIINSKEGKQYHEYNLALKNKDGEYQHYLVDQAVYQYVIQLEFCINYPESSKLKEKYPEKFLPKVQRLKIIYFCGDCGIKINKNEIKCKKCEEN